MKKHIIIIETLNPNIKDLIEESLDDNDYNEHDYKLTSKIVEVEETVAWALDTLKNAVKSEISSGRKDVHRALEFLTENLKSGKKKKR